MNTLRLLPRWCRFIGLLLILPPLILFVMDSNVVFGDFVTPFSGEISGFFVTTVPALLDQTASVNGEFVFMSWIKNDMSNELLLAMMLIGTYLIAFARVKEEDEFIQQLRLESMTNAIVLNSALLLILNFLTYEGLFVMIMISQLFSFLLIFSIIFALKVRKQRRGLIDEE